MKTFWIIVIILVVLFLFSQCTGSPKVTWPKTVGQYAKMTYEELVRHDTKMSADHDTLQAGINNPGDCRPPSTIWRTKTVVVQQPSNQSAEPVYYSVPSHPQSQSAMEQPQRNEPQTGTVVPGDLPGPQDLLFCVDLEPAKSTDSSKKFLFWELVNNLGYQISGVVPNFTGRSANMRLTPGSSVDGISYDGEILKMSVSSVGNWYAQIMGAPMPSDFRPALRSNKSGWSSRLMSRSGDYFVYRF